VGLPAAARAAPLRLAVLEVASDALALEARMTLADEARAGALDATRDRGVLVLTRESMSTVLADMGTCVTGEGDCEIETARTLGVDYVVTGAAARVDDAILVTWKVFDVRSGALLAARRQQHAPARGLIDGARVEVAALVVDGIALRPRVAPVPAAAAGAPGDKHARRFAAAWVIGKELVNGTLVVDDDEVRFEAGSPSLWQRPNPVPLAHVAKLDKGRYFFAPVKLDVTTQTGERLHFRLQERDLAVEEIASRIARQTTQRVTIDD
jgi:hypothetical protein